MSYDLGVFGPEACMYATAGLPPAWFDWPAPLPSQHIAAARMASRRAMRGTVFGIPIVTDASVPPGEVQLRTLRDRP
jgi:hypothetical protein